MITEQLSNTWADNLKGMATMVVADPLVKQSFDTQDTRAEITGCCYPNFVLADLSNTDDYRNDRSTWVFKRLISTDTVTMVLQKYVSGSWTNQATLNDDTYGIYYDFGDLVNLSLKGYKLSWYLVLAILGEGSYRVQINRTILGVSDTLYSLEYTLRSFTTDIADMTVRLEWYQDGKLTDGIDYTGVNWYRQHRVPGFFGDRQAQKEEVVWKDSAYRKYQVRSDILYTYSLEIGWIAACLRDVFLYCFEQGYQIYISDYNVQNFDWNLKAKPVMIEQIDETEYDHQERIAKFKFTLNDITENHIKKSYE